MKVFKANMPIRWLILGLCGLGMIAYLTVQWMLQAKVDPSTNPPLHMVEIPEGLSFHHIALRLDEQGLLNHRGAFELLAKRGNLWAIGNSGILRQFISPMDKRLLEFVNDDIVRGLRVSLVGAAS